MQNYKAEFLPITKSDVIDILDYITYELKALHTAINLIDIFLNGRTIKAISTIS